jgi:hypothetical protein
VAWTTRGRELLITPDIEPFVYRMLAVKSHELGGYAFAINGMPDHGPEEL